MTFEEIVEQVLTLMKRQGRVSYSGLRRQFEIDDAYLNDLKDELLYVHPIVDDNGRGLIWNGDTDALSTPSPAPSPLGPLSYTPPHLAEKILTSRSALEGERKQVTVLFCDLANSTPMADRLGPEEMHRLLNRFFELALDEVHQYEGTINQFLGDGFMALFGAPIAHEDHSRRAVLAAKGIQQRLRQGPSPLGQAYGAEVETRMGLHTGEVIVGAIGDNLRMDYTAIGDTTNVAARLQGAAEPGQIVISESTFRLIEGYSTTRSLGELALKGKADPVAAWEVLRVSDTRTRLDVEAARGLTPFVGRDNEIELLETAFSQAQHGNGQCVFIVGEAGLGKSRLLLELRRRLGTTATWNEGRAMSFGRAFAFHPIVDLLKRTFQIEEEDTEDVLIEKVTQRVLRLSEEMRPILPYVRYLLSVDPGDPKVETMDPQLRRAEIFDALRLLLLRASEEHPQVLVFEDLHWMDPATENFLMFLGDSIPSCRVLCLFTYRPGYSHPFGDRSYHTRLVLPTLSAADSIQMAEAVLGAAGMPQELEVLIAQKAEGNPFFVEEVVKSLHETNAIRRDGERYVLTGPLDAIVVPNTIQDVLMARIDRLEEAPKKALQLAAVIGREFTHRLLDRLADIQDRTAAYLRELQAIELIYEKSLYPELVYMFKHALTQDVAYHSLLAQQRQDLHGFIGEAIEELYADRLPEQYDVLAYHYARGGRWNKALTYFCQAAQKAMQAFATREAITLYDQALEMADHLGDGTVDQTRMAIYQAQSNLYWIRSDFERSYSAAQRWHTLARKSEDRLAECTALNRMGLASVYADHFDRALTESHQALALASETASKLAMAGSHFNIAVVYGLSGEVDKGLEVMNQTLMLSQESGDVVYESLALWGSGLYQNWQGDYREALRLQRRAVQIARDHQLLHPLLSSLWSYGLILTGKGEYDEALEAFEEALSLAQRVGAEIREHLILNSLGWLYLELGDLDRGLDFNQQCVEKARRRNDTPTLHNAEINIGDTFLARGDLALAQEIFEEVHRRVCDPATNAFEKWRYSLHLYASLGELWLASHEPSKAWPFVEQCLEESRRTQSRKYIVKGLRLRGEIASQQHQWEEAETGLREAVLLARSLGNPTQLWKTYLAMGHLYRTTQQPARAQEYYQAACDVIYRIKIKLKSAALRESLEYSPVIQQVYHFRMSVS